MKTLMIIETAHNGIYFPLTYMAAFLLAAGIAIYSGFSKGHPKLPWLLILLSGGLFFIIGEKMFSYSPEQWTQVFTQLYFPPTAKKTILGGIVGLFAGLLLSKYILGFKLPVLDNFSIALPVAMAISRIGCLLAGCCYGTPTNVLWGINYDTSSMVYHNHLSHGLIKLNDTMSLTIHPVQLYQVFGCLMIALIVWKSRKYWKASGSMFLFSVLSYALLRFFVEFVRDPDSSFVLVNTYYGIKAIQWVLLTGLFIGFITLKFRESGNRKKNSISQTNNIQDIRLVLLVGLIAIIASVGRNWFTNLELLTLIFFLTPVTIATIVQLYRNHTVPGFRWVTPLVFLGGCMFMAQTNISDEKDRDKTKFTELGISGILGNYYEDINKVCYSGGCVGKYYEYVGTQKKSFYQGGIDVSHNMWYKDIYKFKIGARFFYGEESKGDFKTDYPSGTMVGVSPYLNFDWRGVGFGGGFSVGQMKFGNRNVEIDQFSTGTVRSKNYDSWHFIPAFSLRLGPSDIFYVEANVPGLFPSSVPYPLYQIGFGSGLGKTNGTKAAIGYCKNGIYSELTYPIKGNKYLLKAFYANSLASGKEAKSSLSVGINFRFFSK